MESKHYMIINMSKNGLESRNIKYDFETGQIKEIQLPLTGIVLVAPESTVSDGCYIENTSWTQPMNFYQYDASTDKFSKGAFYSEIQYPGTENLTSKEVEVTSYDGVKVPLSLVYDKSKLKKDGSNICLMFGYGAYGMTMSPTYAYMMLPLLKRGGIAAFAHVRGGGEKGESWHLAGYKTTKPNTWKDFNACAEYLIKNQYTSSSKLGCTGASAGGILIGRAVTERPDLYKVAVPMVGCLNALRMENDANGPVNIPEFGTVKDSVECAALIKMDALHFVKKGTIYPAMLITTGFNDPRVASWIPGKFAAAMQADNAGNTPVLLYVNYKGGHFGGSTVNEMIHERAMETAFLLWQCGDPEFQMKR
jgi:prolyl oligopeptidase